MAILKNPRHEKFVQGLIQGMSQRKAYREAFPAASKWKDTTVDVKASKLSEVTINKLDCFIDPVNPLVTKGALLYLPIWQVMCALILFRELRDASRSRLCLAQTRSAIHICGKPLLSFCHARFLWQI